MQQSERVEFRERQLTRRQRLVTAALVAGVLVGAPAAMSIGDESFPWQHLPMALVWGWFAYWFGRAPQDNPLSVLRLDAEGVHDATGARLHSWSGVQAVWVGRPRWRVGGPELRLYTEAQSAFDRRAGAGVHPRLRVTVPGRPSPEQAAAAVRRFSTAPVVVGDRRSLRGLEARLSDRAR